jgi:hypothetical protein
MFARLRPSACEKCCLLGTKKIASLGFVGFPVSRNTKLSGELSRRTLARRPGAGGIRSKQATCMCECDPIAKSDASGPQKDAHLGLLVGAAMELARDIGSNQICYRTVGSGVYSTPPRRSGD